MKKSLIPVLALLIAFAGCSKQNTSTPSSDSTISPKNVEASTKLHEAEESLHKWLLTDGDGIRLQGAPTTTVIPPAAANNVGVFHVRIPSASNQVRFAVLVTGDPTVVQSIRFDGLTAPQNYTTGAPGAGQTQVQSFDFRSFVQVADGAEDIAIDITYNATLAAGGARPFAARCAPLPIADPGHLINDREIVTFDAGAGNQISIVVRDLGHQ